MKLSTLAVATLLWYGAMNAASASVNPSEVLKVQTIYVLAAAPSATDNHVENYAVPLGIYYTSKDCMDARRWIMEHNFGMSHIWCGPVTMEVPG